MAFQHVIPLRARIVGPNLESVDGTRCYAFGRVCADALMGKVVDATACVPGADGGWVLPPEPERHRVAIKVVFRWCIERRCRFEPPHEQIMEDPMHEMDVHAYLSQPGHDNIARLQCVLEDDARFYIVQEYCDGGELFDLIRAQGRMPEAVAREYARHMVHGALNMHTRATGWAHRDISLENTMLSTPSPAGGGSIAKLIDFGLATETALCVPAGAEPVGKESYMAPEVAASTGYDAALADVWCLGASVFLMLFGGRLYNRVWLADPRFADLLRHGVLRLMDAWNLTDLVTLEARDLLNRTLTADPTARITMVDVSAHPWFAAGGGAAETP